MDTRSLREKLGLRQLDLGSVLATIQWIVTEMSAEINPTHLIFCNYHHSLFLIDPAWEKFNHLFKLNKWLILDESEDGTWGIVGHKVFEGKVWNKVTRFRKSSGRSLRPTKHGMDAQMFAEIDPARLIFYIFHQSLFLIYPVWENFNHSFKWISIDSADLKRTLDSD